MKKFSLKRIVTLTAVIVMMAALCVSCAHRSEYQKTTAQLATNQPTPTDISYSLERHNLIRRAYWVNGQRDKALNLVCEVEKPLGYIVLFVEGCGVVGKYMVDGKISSLNSYLVPDSDFYSNGVGSNDWIADVDGSYGENDNGIFFFTPDGKYMEWTGTYLYSDIPFELDTPTLLIQEVN